MSSSSAMLIENNVSSVSSTFSNKRILILGHITEIYGPVQALMGYSKKNMGNIISILHPLPCSIISHSNIVIIEKGISKKIYYRKNYKLTDIFLYIQQVFFTFSVLMKNREKFDLCIGIDNLNASCALLLRQIGIVKKVAFYVIDYTPKRFKNPILNSIYHSLDRLCCQYSDCIWNISKRMARIRQKQRIIRKKSIIVPVGIELNKIPLLSEMKLNRKTLVVVSHLSKSKGIDLVINAMTDVIKKVPDVRLEIIGSGPYETELKKLVHNLDLKSCIIFSGIMEHDELINYLPSLGIALATYEEDPNSITYFADPTKPKEYLACGLPVVITRVPWIAKEIEAKPMGIAINYDVQELVNAIVKLLKDDKFFWECKKNAKAFTADLNWDKIYEKAFCETF